ncbi:hypothetical protein RU639_011087 [Aspergillus parasiticus]|uniref:Uncharacterized protein n=1 Tax=Aspergillus transmontanensis TaxID=1034304 RepID=A0A5N6WH07_9EURO|nr:hypothetical protein BDV41DRAFT_3419 [Aspergillus transmontanensis]
MAKSSRVQVQVSALPRLAWVDFILISIVWLLSREKRTFKSNGSPSRLPAIIIVAVFLPFHIPYLSPLPGLDIDYLSYALLATVNASENYIYHTIFLPKPNILPPNNSPHCRDIHSVIDLGCHLQ